MEAYNDLYKIILAGDANVGKTNLVYRFTKGNENTKNIAPTVGVQFSSKMVKLNEEKQIKAQIWDTAGQEQYRSITAAKALGALVVYDITKQSSFQSVKKWIEGIRDHASQNVVIVIVGNKTDLKNQQVVTTAEGKRLAKELGVFFEETSALTNDNVDKTFMVMLEQIYKRRKEEGTPDQAKNGFVLGKQNKEKNEQKCEC